MKTIGLTICVVLLVAGAAVHGAISHRWGSLAPTASRATALHGYTLRLPEFQSEEIPSEIEVKEKSSVTCKRYVSTIQGIGGVVSVTTGPAGAVSTHTPDVCYPSSGYKTVVPPTRETLDLPDGRVVSYYVAEFEKKSATQSDRHRVRWAWATAASTNWNAPDNPRFDYFREPELYKIYVVTPAIAPEQGQKSEDTPKVREFVQEAFSQYTAVLADR